MLSTSKDAHNTPEELEKIERQIAELYKQEPLWHGTGRYRYAFRGQSKYDGVDYDADRVDVLKSILTTGLRPSYDPWGVTSSGQEATLSLSEQRMLARVVAEARQPEGEQLEYEFGSSRFWWLLLMKREGLERLMTHEVSLPTAVKSMAEVNKNIEGRHSENYVDVYTETRSTIPGNFSVIFGLKREKVQASPLKNMDVSSNFEQRAVLATGLESFSHVEVPIRHVRETQLLLESLGIDLPVLPIEEAELYVGKEAEKIYAENKKGRP